MRVIKTIIGGNKKGKNVLLISGVHGDEATPIYTLSLILKDIIDGNSNLKISKINSLTIINGVNESGILNHQRDISNEITNDLNRSFDTINKDSVKLLKKFIDINDVIIDIHSSPSCVEFALIDIDEYTTTLKKWCDDSDVKTAYRYSSANTIKRYSLTKNKISLTLEINKLIDIDIESAKRTLKIINNLISNVHLVKLKKHKPNVQELLSIKTYISGIYIDEHTTNIVKKGHKLGYITDFEGNKKLEIKAPTNGSVITHPNSTIISRGETLYFFQPMKKK